MPDSPARYFGLAGAINFRDLGGYRARDGRTVRWRQIFRSNHLGHLTAADIGVLRPLGLKSAFDFRGSEERAAAICGLDEIAVHSLPIEPTVVAALRARLAAGISLASAEAVEIMRDSYRHYVEHNTPRFRALFAHLLEDRAPLVIHCTAGKDRTGFASALLLSALGIDRAVIVENYLESNRHNATANAQVLAQITKAQLPQEVIAPLLAVDAAYIEAALQVVEDEYAGMENYLRNVLDIDVERIRGNYLE